MPAPVQWVPLEERKAHLKRGPHRLTGRLKRLPWPFCVQCGLLALKNDVTKRALRRQCEWLD